LERGCHGPFHGANFGTVFAWEERGGDQKPAGVWLHGQSSSL